MYAASLVLLGGAAVTLVLGIQAEGLGLLYASIACSGLAWTFAVVAAVRRLRRGRTEEGR